MLKISDFILIACKSDNWRSVENITLENFRLHVKVIIGGQ